MNDTESFDETILSVEPPELLAPAGNADCVRAAIENGADAVYFGLECGFNARARAHNFPVADLPELMDRLHLRGLSGYVTLNTLVFPSELREAESLVVEISRAGVDAVLVQDLGLVRLVRELCPDLPVHASTQMTMTSAEGIAEIQSLGVERVVVGRELSVREIRKIRERTTMPLEVFVHGALCVAYSGQCLTSESLGGRSANRGQCAQACRLPYDLIVDGQLQDMADQKYLLSPQDLAAYGLIPDLIDAGVCSLKIEGRLKTPEYVASITRHYRSAIDHAMASRQDDGPTAASTAGPPIDSEAVQEMELSFSRGFSHGWLEGCDHKMLVPGLSSAKRGILAGEIHRVGRRSVVIRSRIPLQPGDGVVFDGDRANGTEQGGSVYQVDCAADAPSGCVELRFGRGAVDFEQLLPGQTMWKTSDPRLSERLRKTFQVADPVRRRRVNLKCVAEVGKLLQITAQVDDVTIHAESDQPLVEATKHPLTRETLRSQFGRLGASAYTLGDLDARIVGRPMLPLSLLGRMRREMIIRLDRQLKARPPRRIQSAALDRLHATCGPAEVDDLCEPVLHVMCRSIEQMTAAIQAGGRNLYVDFHDIREYRSAVAKAHDEQASIFLATPRIQKPDEFGLFRAMSRYRPDGFLVRNLAGMKYFVDQGFPVVADFSLNVTNELTAAHLTGCGVRRWTASYDLNREQLIELIDATASDSIEAVVHQHMPMFHMEHCVFCSVISPGTNKTNCGRPCDRHSVQLRDRVGMEHPLHADVGCRNTLFNATAQSAAEIVPALIEKGVRAFRIELLEETPVAECIQLYGALLRGEVTGQHVWQQLRASNRVGVTRGTLEERRNPLTII